MGHGNNELDRDTAALVTATKPLRRDEATRYLTGAHRLLTGIRELRLDRLDQAVASLNVTGGSPDMQGLS